MSEKPDIICPEMSARTTTMSAVIPGGEAPILTPTIVKCQEGECRKWDKEYSMCYALSGPIRIAKQIKEYPRASCAYQRWNGLKAIKRRAITLVFLLKNTRANL